MKPDHNQQGSISPPVGIAVLGTGITRIVNSLPAAAEVLHDHWPKGKSRYEVEGGCQGVSCRA
jgi:hypothetical protein